MSDDLDSILGISRQLDGEAQTQPVTAQPPAQVENQMAPMADIEAKAKKFSWSLFAVVLLCFFLPFFEVSCQGHKLLSVSGLQLAFGMDVPEPTIFGPPKTRSVPGDSLVLLTFLLAGAGLGLSFVKGKLGHLLPAICGALGFLGLLITKARIDNDMLKQSGGMLTIEYAIGFIAACLLFLLAAVGQGFLYFREKKAGNSS